MKKYLCPKCGKKEAILKFKMVTCLACGHTFSTKAISKSDLHFGKHLPGYVPYKEKPQKKVSFIAPDADLVKKTEVKNKKIKQHFESRVSAALRSIPNLWYMKVQVNPMAHHATVADFLILTENHNIAFECKEIDASSNNQFPFSRFSQIGRMKEFKHALARNESFIGILIWNGEFSTSDIYIIPVDVVESHIVLSAKKSMNIKEIQEDFANYKIPFNNLELYIKTNWV